MTPKCAGGMNVPKGATVILLIISILSGWPAIGCKIPPSNLATGWSFSVILPPLLSSLPRTWSSTGCSSKFVKLTTILGPPRDHLFRMVNNDNASASPSNTYAGLVGKRWLAERIATLTDLILPSEVKCFVADVQDRVPLVIEQEFAVPSNYGHVELTIRGEDLQPVMLLLPNFDSELGPMIGMVGEETKWVTRTTDKVSSRPEAGADGGGAYPCIGCEAIAVGDGRLRTKTGGTPGCSFAFFKGKRLPATRSTLEYVAYRWSTNCMTTIGHKGQG